MKQSNEEANEIHTQSVSQTCCMDARLFGLQPPTHILQHTSSTTIIAANKTDSVHFRFTPIIIKCCYDYYYYYYMFISSHNKYRNNKASKGNHIADHESLRSMVTCQTA